MFMQHDEPFTLGAFVGSVRAVPLAVVAIAGLLLGGCPHGPVSGHEPEPCPAGCWIAEVCWPAGTVDENGSCRICDPARDARAWSNRDNLACDDGLACTVNDTCQVGECTGEAWTCDDGVACNGVERCDEAAGRCVAGTTTCAAHELCDFATDQCVTRCTGCAIDATCYGDGQRQPSEPCRICDVARATDAWSDHDGARCDDGLFCTVDDTCTGGSCAGGARDCDDGVACNGVEICDVLADICLPGQTPCPAPEVCDVLADRCVTWCPGCAVGGLCYGAGQTAPGNVCFVCDLDYATDAWHDNDGVPCDDGDFCTVGDTCGSGTCTGAARGCDDGVGCNGVERCDTGAAACLPGTPTCGVDELCDLAADACVLTCTGCAIAGVCYRDGELAPSPSCRVCDVAADPTAWTSREGEPCDDGLFCTVDDTCAGPLTCTGSPRDCRAGRVCDDNQGCDELADQCQPSVTASCAAAEECAEACLQLGAAVPYFAWAVSPARVPTAGGSLVTYLGFFGPASEVVVETPGVVVTEVTEAALTILAPAGNSDARLTVTGAGGGEAAWLVAGVDAHGRTWTAEPGLPLGYLPPIVTAVSGCAWQDGHVTRDCSVTGGEALVVSGQGFGTDPALLTVDIAGLPCASVGILEPDRGLECVLPAAAVGGFDLTLSVSRAGQTGSLPGAVSYSGPVIVDVVGPAELDPAGGELLTITGVNFAGTVQRVYYGPPGFEWSCEPVIFSPSPPQLTCTTTPGTGRDFQLRVKIDEQWSKPAATLLSYRLPVLLPGTLRTAPGDAGAPLLILAEVPTRIFFDVVDYPPTLSQSSVWLTDGTTTALCHNLSYAAFTAPVMTATCIVAVNLSSAGVPLGAASLVVRVPGGESAPGTDLVLFPEAPEITSISGCADAPPTTLGCPTEGGVTLTLDGQQLHTPLSMLTVDGSSVPYVETLPDQLTFKLPPGAGSATVQLIDVNGVFSPSLAVGYAPPLLEAVGGCTDGGATTYLCPRAGGVGITVTGQSFGPAGALVLVDGQVCANAVHDAVTPHRRLTCTLPAGAGFDVPVLVISGGVASNAGVLSYRTD